MKALVFTALSEVTLLDVDDPVPGPGELLIRVKACGVCGSDLHGITHPSIRVPPLVMGHEFAGVTDNGRRVVVNPLIACGACDLCAAGTTELCRQRAIIGIHRGGGYAESVVVPSKQVHDLPDGISFTQAALIEPLSNAVHAWRHAGLDSPARIGVLGAGTVGLVSLLVAKAFSDAEVVVADLSTDRQATALSLKADATIDRLSGEFDVIFDAVGATVTRRASLEFLRPGGTAIWLGLLDDESPVSGLDLVRSEKRVVGSFCYSDDDFQRAITLCESVDASWLTTFSLSEAAETFTGLMRGRTDISKAVFVP